MPGIDFSRPLLAAGASAQCSFAAAQARTGLDFTGEARFKRGVRAEIGLEAFADASAELSKFVHANIAGTAFARAKAGIQLQLPLNLFDEFGFSARAEAIAEAAAGLVVDLGLSIGDFVLLAKRDPDLVGLPLELLLLFLEEVSIGGAFEIDVSASAKAHASISVSGRIVEHGGEKAGFFYTVDAGVGLAAGVGMGFKAGAEFRDFRRFFGRAVDRAVDTTIAGIVKALPSGLTITAGEALVPWLQAFAPVAKTALRIAYEVGSKVAANNPGATPGDAAALCHEAIKTFVEEAQRFAIGKMLEAALAGLRRFLEQRVPLLSQAQWDAAAPQRSELAAQLLAMPDEPFQDTSDNLGYWSALIDRSIALGASLAAADPQLAHINAILYASSELLLQAVRAKVNTASAYATAVGATTVSASSAPFSGAPQRQPPPAIKRRIRAATGGGATVTYADLLQFLATDLVIDDALTACPELGRFLQVFGQDIALAENQMLKELLRHAGAFDPANPAASLADPRVLLTAVVRGLDTYLSSKFRQQILPQVLAHVSDANLRVYIEEVLLAAVVYVKDVGLTTLLNWGEHPIDNDDFTEALAGAVLLLVGRTVVCVGDTLLAAAEESVEHACHELADKLRAGDARTTAIVPRADPDLVRLIADCVQIGGEVLGPMPDATRARVRSLLYQVFDPIAPGQERSFAQSLADDFYIPNGERLRALTDELAAIARYRFGRFVERFVVRMGDYLLAALEDLVRDAIRLVLEWETHLADALRGLALRLRQLDRTIHALENSMIATMQAADVAFRSLIRILGGRSLRHRIADGIKRELVAGALAALDRNPLYRALPSDWRAEARLLADRAVDSAIQSPLLTPVLDAVAALAGQVEQLMPDLRELEPDGDLPEQVLSLLVDRIEENIRAAFGGSDPHVSPAIDLSYRVLVYDPPFDSHWETRHVHIPLGRISIELDALLDIARDAIRALDFYHDALDSACLRLADALASELELAAAGLTRDQALAERSRLTTLEHEHAGGPKETLILCPTALCHYTSAIDVRIRLGGVARSYLGLGRDEAQRVLIFVNGTLIPAESLVVEGSPAASDPATHGLDSNPAAHAGKRQSRSALPASFPNGPVAAGGGGPGGSRPLGSRREIELRDGHRLTSHAIAGMATARPLAPSGVAAALEGAPPGLLLGFTLELDAPCMAEGVNAITVVVIEQGGNRHQHHVTFTVSRRQSSAERLPSYPASGASAGGRRPPLTLRDAMRRPVPPGLDDGILRNLAALSEHSLPPKPQSRPPAPARQVSLRIPGSAKFQCHEELEVTDQRGKRVRVETLRYVDRLERSRQLSAFGLKRSMLAKAGQRLRVVRITYRRLRAGPGAAKIQTRYTLPVASQLLEQRRADARRDLAARYARAFAQPEQQEEAGNAV